jgi:hypothetical protein
MHIDPGVGQYPVQPGPDIASRMEVREAGPRLGVRFCDEILGVVEVAGIPQRRLLELTSQW